MIDVKLLRDMMSYMEMAEETIDSEWGFARSFKQMLKDDDVTSLYYDIEKLLNVCGNCKWEYDDVCCNSDSEFCADFVCSDNTCEYFEVKENENT